MAEVIVARHGQITISKQLRDELNIREGDKVGASELGKAPIDLWLKMRATPLTNPPNSRSLRKFEAGNVFEWIVSLILSRAGILRTSQKWTSYQYDGLLKVTGKSDFIAGGKPDYDAWLKKKGGLEERGIPEVFIKGGEAIIKHFIEVYPNGLITMPLEIKSVSAFMFDAIERKGVGSKIHRLQLFHYLKSENYPVGNLVYICRDDLRMAEYKVLNPSHAEEEYKETLSKITHYHTNNQRPPLEKEIVWDDDTGKFAKNFNVEYSGYLTMLYKYKDAQEFFDKHKPIVSRWNRVLGRVKNGDKMTDKNKLVLEEITSAGFNLDELAKKYVGNDTEEENA